MCAQDVSSVEEVVQLLEQVTSSLASKNYDKSILSLIIRLNASLKTHGSQMELFHCELLDKAQVTLRNACKDTTLDIIARLHILEIIELRAMKWILSDSVINYYKQKLSMVDYDDPDSYANNIRRPLNVNAPLFTPGGNILNQLLPNQNAMRLTSGTYQGSNADIMGQIYNKGSTADRSTEITSSKIPSNNNVLAQTEKNLTEKMEYKFSVIVDDDVLNISSTSHQLAKSAKILLEERYTCNIRNMIMVSRQPLFPDSSQEAVNRAEMIEGGDHSRLRRENFGRTAQKVKKDSNGKITYDREFLLQCRASPLCEEFPPNWEQVVRENPAVVKRVRNNNIPEFPEHLMSWNPALEQWVSESSKY